MARIFSNNWDFRDYNTKEFSHVYHSYPAMMIPQIARRLLEEFAPAGKLNLVFDPYMGSGTTLVESKIKNIKSIGTDINPLARLISKTKITNFSEALVADGIESFRKEMKKFVYIETFDFPNITNWEFWYTKEKIIELLFITDFISKLEPSIQDFFRLGLSECVREVSFTRNNEFKRYKMSADKLVNYNPPTFEMFITKLTRNYNGLLELNSANKMSISTICSFNSVDPISNDIIGEQSVDMVITSPPYGDSRTTVAYGQYSRWANEWFNFENAKNLDKLLMGGRKIKDHDLDISSVFEELNQIKILDSARYNDVLDFLYEYSLSISNVAGKVRSGGRVCYVVGNRTVKGVQINLDYFTIAQFQKYGFKEITTFVRNIPNKRMPSVTSPTNKKGNHVNTMSNEYIVILEKQ